MSVKWGPWKCNTHEFNVSPQDKMAAILADDIFKCIYLNGNDAIPIQISLQFVPTNNKPALLQVMAWRRIGAKPLPEPKLIQSTNEYAALGGDMLNNTQVIKSLEAVLQYHFTDSYLCHSTHIYCCSMDPFFVFFLWAAVSYRTFSDSYLNAIHTLDMVSITRLQ